MIPKALPNVPSRDAGAVPPWRALDVTCATSDRRASVAFLECATGNHSTNAFTHRAIRLESKTLARTLERDFSITPKSTVALMLDGGAASSVAAFACAGLGAKCAHFSPHFTSSEFESKLNELSSANSRVEVVIASESTADVVGEALRKAFGTSSDVPPAVLYAPKTENWNVESQGMPKYMDNDVRKFMRDRVRTMRLTFDFASAAVGGVDYASGAFDAISHESASEGDNDTTLGSSSANELNEEPELSALHQLARGGDALRWTPSLTDDEMMDCEFQIMFTSGTTGASKVVTHTQRQVAMHARSVVEYCEMTREDIFLHVAPTHHVMGAAMAMACAYAVGVKQVIVNSREFNVNLTLEAMETTKATMMCCTSTHLAMLMSDVHKFTRCAANMRLISCGGSTAPANVVEKLRMACPRVRFFSDYGCTEAGGKMCTTLHCDSNAATSELVRAGRAMPLFDVACVKSSETLESVAFDDVECGEVVVRGPTVVSVDGEWHRTGDIATVSPDGSLRIVDRVKDVIVVGGENVYSREVEAVLLEHPAVMECAVFGVRDDLLGEIPCATVVLRAHSVSVNARALVDFASGRLASFKVPRFIAFADALPKNSLGKILKAKLREEWSQTRATRKSTRAQARSAEDIREIVVRELRVAAGWPEDFAVDVSSPLLDLGVRSTHAVTFSRALSERFNIDVPTTIVFDQSTANGIARFVEDALSPASSGVSGNVGASASALTPCDSETIIVGVSLDAPSEIDSLCAYVARAGDGANVISLQRYDVEHGFTLDFSSARHGATDVRFAALMGAVDDEDVTYHGFTRSEAPYIDPHHRVALRHALAVLRLPGDVRVEESRACGVFVGAMWNDDYANLLSTYGVVIAAPSAGLSLGSGLAFLTGRISFTANLSGPSVGVDTACSSSLTSCALGVDALASKRCIDAACGGVNLLLSQITMSKICRLGALAKDGRCKTLDAAADGYGRGEAVGMCVLSSVEREFIYREYIPLGVFVDARVNQDARSSALTAPCGSAQSALIARILETSAARSTSVARFAHYAVHGTGTPLGDPLEINALVVAFARTPTCESRELVLTSVKSKIGHGEGAAGVFGVFAALASALQRCHVSTSHLVAANAHCAANAIFARRQRAPSTTTHLTHAGTSAFGMSGTNAAGVVRALSRERASASRARVALAEDAFRCSIPPPARALVVEYAHGCTNERRFRARVDARTIGGALLDCRVGGQSIFSFAAFADVALAGAFAALASERAALMDFILHRALTLRRDDVTEFDVVLSSALGALVVRSREATHAKCSIRSPALGGERVRAAAPAFGGAWRNERRRRHSHDIARARVRASPTRSRGSFCVDPMALDASLHLWVAVARAMDHRGRGRAPVPVPVPAACARFSSRAFARADESNVASCARGRACALGAASFAGLVMKPLLSSLSERHSGVEDIDDLAYAMTRVARRPTLERGRQRADGRTTVTSSRATCAALALMHCSNPAFMLYASADDVHGSALRAMARTVALELSRCGVAFHAFDGRDERVPTSLDFADGFHDDLSRAVCHELAFEARVAFEPRLVGVKDVNSTALAIRPNAAPTLERSVVVLGGAGGVGREVSMYFSRATNDTSSLNIVSRRGRTSTNDTSSHHCVVSHVACDAASSADLRFGGAAFAPADLIVCANGTLRDASLRRQHPAAVFAVFAAKLSAFDALDASLAFHRASVVACSSIASAFGSFGQANYASANAAMDGACEMKQSRGLKRTSVLFGAWSRVGMASRSANVIARAKRIGLGALEPNVGVACLRRGWIANVVVSPFNWRVMATHFPSLVMFRDLIPSSPRPKTNATHSLATGARDIESVRAAVAAVARALVGEASGHLDLDTPLAAAGLDSLGANELKHALVERFGFDSPATVAYDFPTIRALSDYVASQTTAPLRALAREEPSRRASAMSRGFVEIIGMDAFCASNDASRDGIVRVPRNRFDQNFVMDAERSLIPHHGGFAKRSRAFDNELFGVNFVEALIMCPQHRALLESAFVLRHFVRERKTTSVFVGLTASHYKTDVVNAFYVRFHSQMGTGSLPSVAAGRISYAFDLGGSSLSIDTACSSSLVSFALAFETIRGGRSQTAIAGGACAMTSASGHFDRHVANMLSLDGRCKTFDASADGFVQGEGRGLGVVGDALVARGVAILGAAVNQDGRSSSLTAPNGPSQRVVMRAAMSSAACAREDKVSTHGTGTALGDPIECGAIAAVADGEAVTLEATKSSTGHCETAAGVVAMAQTFRALTHTKSDLVLHLRLLNAYVRSIVAGTVVSIPRLNQMSRARLVGVSAFAFQGTNAHACVVGASHDRECATPSAMLFSTVDFWPLPPMHPHIRTYDALKMRFLGRIHPRDDASALDHVVNAKSIYPGAGFQELASSVARSYGANDAIVRDSVIPAPLVMSRDRETLFDVVVSPGRGRCVVTSNVAHVACDLHRRARTGRAQHLAFKAMSFIYHGARAPSFEACARIPCKEAHARFFAHPAVVDGALQLGAIFNARSDDRAKVPVGVRAYSSSRATRGVAFACVRDGNHAVNGIDVVGLQVKVMNARGGAGDFSSRAPKDFEYELKSFAIAGTNRRKDERFHGMSLRRARGAARARTACCTIAQAQGERIRTVTRVAFATSRDDSEDAARAIVRTIAQEIPHVEFESLSHVAADFAYAEPRKMTHAKGAALEFDADALVLRERRLRRAAKTDTWRRKDFIGQKVVVFKEQRCEIDAALITGGLGAIGLEFASASERLGARVEIASRVGRAKSFGNRFGDARAFKCENAREAFTTHYFPRGVPSRALHAAGTLRDALVSNASAASTRDVVASKSCDALLQSLEFRPLESALACSSIAALTGNPGQANYAFANAALDALAIDSRRRGRPVAGAQFGGWSAVGMAARDASIVHRLERIGAGALAPARGLALIARILRGDVRDVVASPFDWSRVAKSLPELQMFADVVVARASADARSTPSTRSATKANGMSVHDIEQRVAEVVNALVGTNVPRDAPLAEAGLDSQAANELKNEIDGAFPGLDVPVTVAYDFPTIAALSHYIASGVNAASASSVSQSVVTTSTSSERSTTAAAVVGADVLSPTPSGDGAERIPMHRWDNQWYVESVNLLIPSFSAFVRGYELFDDELFAVARAEATLMDVQQRSILEGVLTCRLGAFANLREDALDGDSCGVFVAISAMQYQNEVIDRYVPNRTSPYIATGNTLSVAAGRASFIFGYRGPCLSLDTACSSSVVAMHLTLESLRTNECQTAAVAGVISILGPGVHAIFFSSGMLSPSGRCRSLDAEADGYCRGEARGVFIVRAFDVCSPTHENAGASARTVAIVGTAVNQDGRSSSLTAPHGPSQSASLRRALRSANVVGEAIEKLQMHGTGTPLGDPIEVGATIAALARPSNALPMSLEAHKSHVGHTETASGMVALMQPLISLVHGYVEKILHLRTLNPHVESIVKNARCAVSHRTLSARAATTAGASSFAFQGTNANAIQRLVRDEARAVHPLATPLLHRQVFWPLPTLHPHLYAFVAPDARGTAERFHARFHARCDGRLHAHVLDHRVLDRALYPGAGFQELASALGRIFNANAFAVVRSTVPAPLYLRERANTEFQCTVRADVGAVTIRTDGASTHMRCSTRRLHCASSSASTQRCSAANAFASNRSSIGVAAACAKIRAPEAQRHLDYTFVNPACLDNALQCGAAINAGASDVMVPVGVKAYAAREIPARWHTLDASATPTNYVLESADVVGLQIKRMRRGASAPKRGSASGANGMLYAVRWFASKPCVDASDLDGFLLRVERVHALAAALSATQQKSAQSMRGLTIQTSNAVSGDGVQGFSRTAAQEMRNVEVICSRTSSASARRRSTPPAMGGAERVPRDAYEVTIASRVMYERRLRPELEKPSRAFTRASMSARSRVSVFMEAEETYGIEPTTVISGGLGAVGAQYARHLDARARARAFALGRTGRSRDVDAASFRYIVAHKCDAGFADDSRSIPWDAADDMEIVHAAGVLRDALIRRQNAANAFAVVGAKVTSWFRMFDAMHGAKVRNVVHCSSISALSGSEGQSNYSAANAMLESCASRARQCGTAQSAIAWGAWANTGMADANVLARVDAAGFGVVTPERGVRALETVMSSTALGVVVATPYDFVKFANTFPVVPRLYLGLIPKKVAAKKTAIVRKAPASRGVGRSTADIQSKIMAIASGVIGREVGPMEPLMDAGLDSIGGSELQKSIEDEFSIELPPTAAFDYPSVSALSDYVASQMGGDDGARSDVQVEAPQSGVSIAHVRERVLAIASGVVGHDIGASEPLVDAGIDSLSGQELKSQIEDEFGVDLPATAAFDYPTVDALSDFVANEIGASAAIRTVDARAGSFAVAAPQKIVVARSHSLNTPQPPDADAIRRVPAHRWDMEDYQQHMQEYMQARVVGYNLHIPGFGGFLERYEYFDAKAFGISSLEALWTDIQQRSLLEGVARAIFRADAIVADALDTARSPSRAFKIGGDALDDAHAPSGVYVGIASCDYGDELLRNYIPILHPFLVVGSSLNVAAGRISFTFNCRGPSMSVDTACSASLVTTHLASVGLRSGETSSAVSCGVQALLSAHITGIFHSSGMLANDGRCKTFDVDADGYVRGESRGVLALDAGDDDAVSARTVTIVIAGTAVNQDGRSSSLTAPNGPSQGVVVRAALRAAHAAGADVDALHAHGTGTPLGDPIEFGAALAALERSKVAAPVTFQASKSAVGHTETAAGIVNILAPVITLARSTVRRITHLSALNPHCASLAAAAKAPETSIPKQSAARAATLASVSGFAFQGTNANACVRVDLRKALALGVGREYMFHRERFYPLPHLFPHLNAFSTLEADVARFSALVDTRVHGHVLDAGRTFPVGGLLELASATARIMDISEIALRGVNVLAPLVLFSKSSTTFEVCAKCESGDVVVQSNGGADAHMTCAFHKFIAPSRASERRQCAAFYDARLKSQPIGVRACVRPNACHEHFEYNVNPMCVENALMLRTALELSSDALACASCVRYSTPESSAPKRAVADAVASNSMYALQWTIIDAPTFKPLKSVSRRDYAAISRAVTVKPTPVARAKPLAIADVQRRVRALCSKIIGTEIDAQTALADCGVDSLAAAELRSAIQHEFAIHLPITAAFDCPSADALGAFVFARLPSAPSPTPLPPRASSTPVRPLVFRPSFVGVALRVLAVLVLILVLAHFRALARH